MSEKLSKEEQEKARVKQLEQKFQNAASDKGKNERIWRTLNTFDRFQQWDDEKIPPWVPKPITNLVRYIRILKRANLSVNVSKANFSPLYIEDRELIDKYQFAYDHVWETVHVPRVIRGCIDRAAIQGTAIAYVYTDDEEVNGKYFGEDNPNNALFQGEIKVKRISNFDFFVDPTASRIDEAGYVITRARATVADVRSDPRYKEYAKENGTSEKLQKLTSGIKDDPSGLSSSSKYEQPGVEKDKEFVTVLTHWERYKKEGVWTLDVTIYVKGTDFILLKIENYMPNEYPFAVLYDEEEEDDFWGTGSCFEVLEQNKVINKVDQVAAILGTLHQNPQKYVSRESGINIKDMSRTGTLPGKAWHVNGDPRHAVHIATPPDIPRGLLELKNDIMNTSKDMAGFNEAYMGNSVGSLTTSSGVTDLIERATIRDRDKMVQIDAFVERISHLIGLNILHKWTQDRPLVRSVQGGGQEHSTFNPMTSELAPENLYWRVKVDTYAKSPMTQASQRAQVEQLLQMQGQFKDSFDVPIITPEEAIRFLNFDMSREILQRMKTDREKLEQQSVENMTNIAVQAAMALEQMKAQGMPPEQMQMALSQFVQQLMMPQQGQGAPTPGGMPSQAPNGAPGPAAMAAMMQG